MFIETRHTANAFVGLYNTKGQRKDRGRMLKENKERERKINYYSVLDRERENRKRKRSYNKSRKNGYNATIIITYDEE